VSSFRHRCAGLEQRIGLDKGEGFRVYIRDVRKSQPKHPNKLRECRVAAVLSREQLAALTTRAAEQDPILFAPISPRSLERLERGEVRPHPSTARTLAHVLLQEVADLFASGTSNSSP